LDHEDALKRLIEKYKVYHCVECGKCTGTCPLAQVDKAFSPRLVAKYAIEEGLASDYVREKILSCLTCGLCDERCPIGIPFTAFVREVRPLYKSRGYPGHLSHGGALQGLMRMQAAGGLKQHRLDWITPDLKIASRGEVLYFVGCIPYFDAFFKGMAVDLSAIARDTVKILNAMGIEPVLLPDERCCGHDLIWTGDGGSFQRLRRLNLASFRRSGAETIVTACAECSYVLRQFYPSESEPFPFEVMHISEFLQKKGMPEGKHLNRKVTYQDPCRLGRFQGVYEAPRALMGALVELREMPHFGPGAWCCGNSAWLHCDRYSKQLQIERLLEAKSTKADMIVTACPKCQVHLTCAMQDANRKHDLRIKIKDLTSLIAESLDK